MHRHDPKTWELITYKYKHAAPSRRQRHKHAKQLQNWAPWIFTVPMTSLNSLSFLLPILIIIYWKWKIGMRTGLWEWVRAAVFPFGGLKLGKMRRRHQGRAHARRYNRHSNSANRTKSLSLTRPQIWPKANSLNSREQKLKITVFAKKKKLFL